MLRISSPPRLFKSSLFVRNPIRVLLPFALAMTAFPLFGAELSIEFEVVARSGVTPVPGGDGTITGFSGYPAIDSSGNIVFTATGGPDNNGASFQSGIYTFIDGQLQTVANTYTLIPGGGGATFGYFPTSMHNDIEGGRVAFTASLNGNGSLLGLYSNVGQPASNDLVAIAVDDGIEWEEFKRPWVDGNVVAVAGKRLIPNRHTTIMRWNGTDLSRDFVVPGTGYNFCASTETSISGDAAVFCRYNSNATELAISSSSGDETLVTLNVTPIPGQDGAVFTTINQYPVFGQNGQNAALTGAGGGISGVYKRFNSGALTQVADTEMVVPDADGG